MRQVATALGCAVIAGAVLHAQGQQPNPPAFRGGVSLITVDVTVLDREGKPVPGLGANDFQVKLNGKVQPVRAVSFLEARIEAPPAESAPKAAVMPQMFPVAPVADVRPQGAAESRVFVILVDDLSFPALDGKGLFTAAQRFLAGLPPADLVGVATSSGTRTVNPTSDRAPVAAALGSVVGEYMDPRGIDRGTPAGGKASGPDQSLGISQSLDIDRGDESALKEAVARECFNGDRGIFNTNSVAGVMAGNKCASDLLVQARRTAALTRQTTERQAGAFQSVIRAMKGASGIKHLVLVTAGVGVTFDASSLEPVARAAAEAGIQLSVMTPEPGQDMTSTGRRDPGAGVVPQTDAGMSQRHREDGMMFVNGAHTLADMVGGAFYRVVGDPDPFFKRVAVASSAIYRLAVEPPTDTAAGKEFSLVATVRRSGLTVQANKRAVAVAPGLAATSSTAALAAPAATAVVTVDDQLRAAMNTGRGFDGVPIDLSSRVRRAADGSQMEVGVRVQIPSTAKGPLTAAFGIVDAAGKMKSGRRVIDPPPAGQDYDVAFAFPVEPGAYRLRFAVADGSGRVGAVEKAVRAELVAMGPFGAGDLQFVPLDADDKPLGEFPPADELPAAAKTLNASLELYPLAGAAAPADILVKIAFGATGQPPVERIVVPVNDNGVWRAEAEFALEKVAPGTYSIVATVLADGKVVGTTSASIRRK